MTRNRWFFALALVLMLPAWARSGDRVSLRRESSLPDLPFLDQVVTTKNFVIHYTLTNCGSPGNNCLGSHAQARAIANILEDGFDLYVNHPDYGFNRPVGTGAADNPKQLNVYILDLQDTCGVAMWATPVPHDYMKLDAGCIRDRYDPADLRGIQATPLHELFHRVQYSYDKGPEEKWSYEGSATAMQDKVYGGAHSLDSHPSSSYLKRANRYLNNPNRVDYDDYGGRVAGLRDAAYYACLFWTYFMETCGEVGEEPQRGVDALRLYWEQTISYHNVEAMDYAVRAAPGCPDLYSMEDLFHDFIVTNYVKLMGNVGERYRYADEHGPAGVTYDEVLVEAEQAISRDSSLELHDQAVAAWGANYYVARPDGSSCNWIEVEVDAEPGSYLLYTIVAVDAANNAYFYGSPRFRYRGEDLVRKLHNDGWDRVTLVVGAGDAGARYSVQLRCVAPAASRPRCPGYNYPL